MATFSIRECFDGQPIEHATTQLGVVLQDEIKAVCQDPQLISDDLIPTRETNYNGEKLGDVITPQTSKRGFVIQITKDDVACDRTNKVIFNAREVAYWLRIAKEKRIVRTVVGADNPYRRDICGHNEWNTYQASYPWINVCNGTLCHESLLAARKLLNCIPTGLLVSPTMKAEAEALAKLWNQSHSDEPLTVFASRYVLGNPTHRAKAWFLGDFHRAFAYMQNWGMELVQAPTLTEEEAKERDMEDVVARFKISERGAVAVLDPQAAVKCYMPDDEDSQPDVTDRNEVSDPPIVAEGYWYPVYGAEELVKGG
jgi:hypothetical protein